jgi:hypothetical protein
MRLRQRAAQLTLLPEARLASPPQWQDDGREVLTCDGSGLSFSACAARLLPAGSWQRTLSESLASSLTGLTGCAVSLRVRATKCGRSLLVPTMLGRPTEGSESGSSQDWPTASAGGFEMQDAQRLLDRRAECKAKGTNGNGFGLTLDQATKLEALGLWATPNTMDGGQTSRGGKRKGELLLGGQVRQWPTHTVSSGPQLAEDPTPGQTGGTTLEGAILREAGLWASRVAIGLPAKRAGLLAPGSHSTSGKPADWPTPNAMQGNNVGTMSEWGGSGNRLRESDPVLSRGSLNPAWVESLCGFPTGWLAASPPVTAARRSKALATRSCPSAPRSSAARSSRRKRR